MILDVCVFVYLFVLSFCSKFLVTKPLPRQFSYCPRCLFMMWSGLPAAISVDSATVMEDDWTSKVSVTRTSSKLHRPQPYIWKLRTISGTFHNRVVSEFRLNQVLKIYMLYVKNSALTFFFYQCCCIFVLGIWYFLANFIFSFKNKIK